MIKAAEETTTVTHLVCAEVSRLLRELPEELAM